ncbi:F-box domain-containing protein [Favolaschia claudopus]|uniref:F-box domain-containing protein n=1 Tax=Favolaschia claudopus TaxID=2862362 RepID=A0AAV9ZD48_9AGAR
MSMLALDRALLVEKDTQILELKDKISAIQRSISELRATKRSIQQRISSYKYPVLTLPTEIITHIFLHCIPLYPEPPPLVGLRSPTTLTNICRKWRQIALATPRLWRALKLTPSYMLPPEEIVASIVALWTERSACTPLSIFTNHSPQVMPHLLPHRSRWEYLNLDFDSGSQIKTLHIDGPMPLLRSLTLAVWDAVDTPLPLLEVPLLRTVVIDDHGPPSLVLPWSQLTSLTLRRTHPDACLSILRAASQLVECRLRLWSQHTPLGGGVVVLPRLESLVFERKGEICRDFFQSLVTPALLRLEIPEAFLRPHSVETLKAFISKSGCTLQSLQITELASLLSYCSYTVAFSSIPQVSFL